MRRTGRALFIIFYFIATISVANERCARMVDRVGHSTSSEFEHVESPFASLVQHLPYFSHAKKGKSAVAEVAPEVYTVPDIIVWHFEAPNVTEYFPSSAPTARSSRAPPVRLLALL